MDVGDRLETLRLVTLRLQESLLSPRVLDIPPGSELSLLERSDSGSCKFPRARVAFAAVEGWISLATSSGMPLVRKMRLRAGEHLTRCRLLLREGPGFLSPIVAQLEPGQRVLVEAEDGQRALLACGAARGWATLATASARLLVGPAPVSADSTPTSVGTWRASASSGAPSPGASDSEAQAVAAAAAVPATGYEALREEARRAAEAAAAREALEAALRQLRDVLHACADNAAAAPSVAGLRREKRLLEEALQAARAAGAGSEDLARAEERVKVIGSGLRVRQRLAAASEAQDACALRKAILAAEKARVPEAELLPARNILARAAALQQARERLAVAAHPPAGCCTDLAEFRAALDAGRQAGLPEEELAALRGVLAASEARAGAEAALLRALETRDAEALQHAIDQGRERGADPVHLARAEGLLMLELPRREVRVALDAFKEGADIAALEAALEKARMVGLDTASPEYQRASALLLGEKARKRAMEAIGQVLNEVAAVDMDDLEALKEAKVAIQEAVAEAKSAGVPEESLREAEQRRRRVHNAVEDLKGSVRVFCRVRPISERERQLGDDCVVRRLDSMSMQIDCNGQPTNFSFDAVFTPGTQEEVFEDCADLVQSALDGYNVTMFAYGQTGAGKTFTMYGAPGNAGTAPRTIRELFRLMERDAGRFEHRVAASMMELYRNELFDLLVARPAKRGGMGGSESSKLAIRTEPKTSAVVIEGLTEETCSSAESLSELLARGNKQRSVAATAMNKESSRSHLLLVIRIVRVNRETKSQTQGKILLCDLAGSERLKKSEVAGEMMKEAIEINKSLTALGDVIESLTTRKGHIPYKNHKLTQVMQDALGGTSKTLMFVNCSPAASNAEETLNALKYASRAKCITNEVKRPKTRSLKSTGGFESLS